MHHKHSGETVEPQSQSSGHHGGRITLLPLDQLFKSGEQITIGRDAECNIHVDHPIVAGKHASLARQGDGFVLTDLSNGRGIAVNGCRVREPHLVRAPDRFAIGPFLFTLRTAALEYLDNRAGIRLEARGLDRIVRMSGRRTKKILDNVSLVVEPGEFVSVIGRSGCGKSTLMETLNGRRRPNNGSVMLNRVNLHSQFDAFRQLIGYVPQKDIVHLHLSAYRAVYYAAQLRLPLDASHEEIHNRVRIVLGQMGMWGDEGSEQHQKTLVGQLSGGQVKRISLAVELLSEPPLLYIDEATSGLDPATEAKMMTLFRELADSGKSIVCITHSLASIDMCHLVAVLESGRLVYYGPPGHALRFFGVGKLHEIYDLLEDEKKKHGDRGVQTWVEKFEATDEYANYVRDRLALPSQPAQKEGGSALAEVGLAAAGIDISPAALAMHTPAENAPPSAAKESSADHDAPASASNTRHSVPERLARRRANLLLSVGHTAAFLREGWHQFKVLTARYLELVWRDKATLRLVLCQAPVIGLILAFGLMSLKPDAWKKNIPDAEKFNDGQKRYLKNFSAFIDVLKEAEKPEATMPAAVWTPPFPATQADKSKAAGAVKVTDPRDYLFTKSSGNREYVSGEQLIGKIRSLLHEEEKESLSKEQLKEIAITSGYLIPDIGADDAPKIAVGIAKVQRERWLMRAVARAKYQDVQIDMDAELKTREDFAKWQPAHGGSFPPPPPTHKKSSGFTVPPDPYLPDLIVRADRLTNALPDAGNPAKLILEKYGDSPVVVKGFFIMPIVAWSLVAILAIAVFWFGCNNAAKEIVKEASIFSRERAAGLRLLPYLGSKFLILSAISVLQALVLISVVYGMLHLKGVDFPKWQTPTPTENPLVNKQVAIELKKLLNDMGGEPVEPIKADQLSSPWCSFFLTLKWQCTMLGSLAVVAVAFGLLISASVSTPDRANALTPYVLIPQILLCGAFLPIEHVDGAVTKLEVVAGMFSPVYWANLSLRCGTNLVPKFVWQHRHEDPHQMNSYIALAVYTAVLLGITFWLLKRKDTAK